MSDPRPIPTPIRQHWQRIRYQLVPVLVFCAASVTAIWLWGQHAGLTSAVGEVEVLRIDVTAPADGMMVSAGRDWQMFDSVQKGDLLARVDDGLVKAALITLQKQIAQIEKELAATEAKTRRDLEEYARERAGLGTDEVVSLRRLQMDIEQLRLQILDRQAQLQTDEIELKRQVERYDAVSKLAEKGVETQARLWDLRLQRDVVKERKEGNEKGLAEAKKQFHEGQLREKALRESLGKLRATTQPASPLDVYLAPIRASIDVEEARMRELTLQIEAREVRAPFSGSVREIFRWAGQTVRMGDPILTLVSEEQPHVMAYVREHHLVEPRIGMRVDMRVRTLPVRTVEGLIDQVGPQIVRVPLQHLRDPKIPEWGLPVRISMPEASGIRAGELVDITFRRPVHSER